MHYFAGILLLISTLSFGQYSEEYLSQTYQNTANRESGRLEVEYRNDYRTRINVDQALDTAIFAAVTELTNIGHVEDAAKIAFEWSNFYKGFVSSGVIRGVGDHDPVVWLYDIWFLLNLALGEEKMQFFHLDDIWEFAYTIPVVFWCEDVVDAAEFSPHFIRLAGATTYWVAMLSCTAFLSGGVYSLICSPAGSLCEKIVVNTIAPRVSNYFWNLSCN